ncbi:MAG TPA: hypothetical protein VG148_10730 [Pyrinomonadaceae bacterium]|nr:hypothetical protein [Pyrinomonadaceae bacterium]
MPKRGEEKVSKKPTAQKSGQGARPRWSWGAAILSFFVLTGVGMNQYGLERDAALFLGGIGGVIFGYYYRQIILFAVIVFIAYALLKNQ